MRVPVVKRMKKVMRAPVVKRVKKVMKGKNAMRKRKMKLRRNVKQICFNMKEDGWQQRQGIGTLAENKQINDSVTAEGCTPVHLWTLVRHGSRYTSDGNLEDMIEDLPALRDKILAANNSNLCFIDKELLKYWNVDDLDVEMDHRLHKEGELELKKMGQRWLKRFPDLLGQYDESKFGLRATNKQRAEKSGEMFITGLWSEDVVPEAKWKVVRSGDDPLIRFYKFCTAWYDERENNEKDLFEESDTVELVKTSISSLLGVNITVDEMNLMYDMCRFNLMWTPNKISPWCRVFSDNDLKVMEYIQDLDSYWKEGPGHPVNYEQACILPKNMLDIFNDIIKGEDKTKGTFYFGHSTAIKMVLSFLKLFVTEDLLSSNFEKMKDKRKWRTSLHVPMAANIAFSLQQCGDEDYKIGLFINEKLIQIPGCNQDWCPMQTFINLFPQIESCDFTKICSINDTQKKIIQSQSPWTCQRQEL